MISKYRLFILIFIPAALVLAMAVVYIQQKNIDLSSAQFEAQLTSQWRLAALLVNDDQNQKQLMSLNKKSGLRVTLIQPDGEVSFDSEANGHLESHKDREEIKKALANTPAMAVRHSRTTNSYMVYYAEKLPTGQVLRIAYPASFYDQQKNALLGQVTAGLGGLIAAVAIFALMISRKTNQVLSSLSLAVKEAQDGGDDLPSFNNDDLDKALFSLSSATRAIRKYSEENLALRQRLEHILANIYEGVLLLENDLILYHNRRAEEILNFKIPEKITEISQQEMIGLFASLAAGYDGDLTLNGNNIIVSQTASNNNRLIMLHDVSDREKYLGYKSDLVGNISHELKTPMTLIMAAAEVIIKDIDIPRPFLEKFLQTIYRNTQRLNILLDNLIFLHQLEGAKEAQPDQTDLVEVENDLKELLGPLGKTVNFSFDQGEARIHATHLLSVLTNLISNAEKYSQGDHIDVAVKKNGATVAISVADQGPVIPPHERERIFERFYSISKSRNREKSGSGLGLSIVKHIARLYNGQAMVEGNALGGNTFTVTLVEK